MPQKISPLRVLIVDDLLANQLVVTDLLYEFGIACVIACDDTQARHTFAIFRPDVALIDLAMPVEDGTQIAAWIRKHYPATRIVIYTAFTNAGKIKLAVDSVKPDAFLPKPFDALDLYRAITGE